MTLVRRHGNCSQSDAEVARRPQVRLAAPHGGAVRVLSEVGHATIRSHGILEGPLQVAAYQSDQFGMKVGA